MPWFGPFGLRVPVRSLGGGTAEGQRPTESEEPLPDAVSTGLLGHSHEVTKTQKITKKRSQNTSVSFRTRFGISKGGQQPR